MPRYFLNLSNGIGDVSDKEGVELTDPAAARSLAVDSIRDIVAEEARSGTIDLNGHIEVADDRRKPLLRVEFVEAFNLRVPRADRAG